MASPAELVTQGINFAQGQASAAINRVNSYVSNINAVIDDLATIGNVNLTITPPITTPTYNAPSAPTLSAIATVEDSGAPTNAPIPNITPYTPDPADKPTYDVIRPTIDVDAIAVPTQFNRAEPTEPTLNSNFTMPAKPTLTDPTEPTLSAVNLPPTPSITLPAFTVGLTALSPSEITSNLAWSETMYSSQSLSDLQNRIMAQVMNGGTMLAPVIEQALWDRARSREEATANQLRREVAESFAGRGFSIPPGAMAAKEMIIEQDITHKQVGLSREIAIKQAEMSVGNIKFAFQQAMVIEQELMKYTGFMQQRAMEMAKAIQDAVINVYKANLDRFQAEIQAYNSRIKGYETELETEKFLLDEYKAGLQGSQTANEVNKTSVEVYTSQLQALKTKVDVYKTEIDAVKAEAEIEKVKLDVFKTQVSVFSEFLQAKKLEFENYETQINAQMSKAKVYSTDVDAYKSKVQAFESLTNANIKSKDNEVAIFNAQLESFTKNIQAFQANISAQSSKSSSQVSAEQLKIAKYDSQAGKGRGK